MNNSLNDNNKINMAALLQMLSTISDVDTFVKNKVFIIPQTEKEKIKSLNGIFNVKDDIKINNEDITLDIHGVHIKPESNNNDNNENKRKHIIFSHGTSCDIFTIYDFLKDFSNKYNVDIITYDYPSFGLSTSSNNDIHENLCYRSHEIIVDYVKNLDVDDDNIYLI